MNNLKIIEKTSKVVFMIDPEEEGFKYLKNRFKVQGRLFLQRIDYQHKSFRKVMEKAINEGTVLFI